MMCYILVCVVLIDEVCGCVYDLGVFVFFVKFVVLCELVEGVLCELMVFVVCGCCSVLFVMSVGGECLVFV